MSNKRWAVMTPIELRDDIIEILSFENHCDSYNALMCRAEELINDNKKELRRREKIIETQRAKIENFERVSKAFAEARTKPKGGKV